MSQTLYDRDGRLVFQGTASGFSGGGGSTERALYGGDPVTVANTQVGILTWDTKFTGDDLLDLTDPENPVVIAAGVYAVTAQINASALTANGYFTGLLDLDLDGDDAQVQQSSAQNLLNINLVATYYLPAAAVLNLSVTSNDGAASRDFSLAQAIIQRIS